MILIFDLLFHFFYIWLKLQYKKSTGQEGIPQPTIASNNLNARVVRGEAGLMIFRYIKTMEGSAGKTSSSPPPAC